MSFLCEKASCVELEGIQLQTAVGLVLKQNLAGRWEAQEGLFGFCLSQRTVTFLKHPM